MRVLKRRVKVFRPIKIRCRNCKSVCEYDLHDLCIGNEAYETDEWVECKCGVCGETLYPRRSGLLNDVQRARRNLYGVTLLA